MSIKRTNLVAVRQVGEHVYINVNADTLDVISNFPVWENNLVLCCRCPLGHVSWGLSQDMSRDVGGDGECRSDVDQVQGSSNLQMFQTSSGSAGIGWWEIIKRLAPCIPDCNSACTVPSTIHTAGRSNKVAGAGAPNPLVPRLWEVFRDFVP